MSDPIEWAKSVGDLVKGYVSRALQPVESRLQALEAKPVRGEKGETGKDGLNGKDGASVTLDDVRPLVDDFIKSVPVPTNGIDGKDGTDGKDGLDGQDGKSVSVDDLRPIVDEFLKAIPSPKDGLNGKDGQDGKSVTLDEVRTYLDAELATWALNFERRAQDVLHRAIERIEKPKDGLPGKDGLNGKDGRDGVSFDEFHVEQVDERTLRHVYTRDGAVVLQKDIDLRLPIYREIYKHGQQYKRDDFVTFGGSVWYALRDTDSKPGTDDSWRLAVKAGRDGKDQR